MASPGKDNYRMKSYKNKALNPQEMRRRREEEGIQLRKQKREEQVGVLKYLILLLLISRKLNINIFLLESSNISKFMNQNPVLFYFSIPLMNLLCQYFYPSAKTYLLLSLFVSLPLSVTKFAP